METAVNRDYSGEILLRVSPESGRFIVEEHKKNGVVSYKEISPLDFTTPSMAALTRNTSCGADCCRQIAFRSASAARTNTLYSGIRSFGPTSSMAIPSIWIFLSRVWCSAYEPYGMAVR